MAEGSGNAGKKVTRKRATVLLLLFLAVVGITLLTLKVDWDLLAAEEAKQPKKGAEVEEVPERALLVKDIYGELAFARDTLSMLQKVHKRGVIVDEDYFKNCTRDPDFFRMYTDPKCLIFWLFKLEYNTPFSIDRVLGVMTREEEMAAPEGVDKPMSNGGMRVTLADTRTQAYWKPCTLDTGHMETYVTEISSFVLDRLLGFFHTPPVVPRFLTENEMLMLAHMAETRRDDTRDEEAVRKVESVVRLCGEPEGEGGVTPAGAEGAMVGWSPFRLKNMYGAKKQKGRFVKFEEIENEEQLAEVVTEFFNVTNADLAHSEGRKRVARAVEIMGVHLYAMVVGNLHKFDHNLFAAVSQDKKTTGPFVYIDNDRSQWRWKIFRTKWLRDGINPMAKICKFPTRIAQRILFYRTFNKKNNAGMTLGAIMLALEQQNVYETFRNGPMWTRSEGLVLDKNIDYLAAMIDHCVEKHGAENVFLDEHWLQPDEVPTFAEVLEEVMVPPRNITLGRPVRGRVRGAADNAS